MVVLTDRLRLEPVGAGNARDLWLALSDDAVWPWYGRTKPDYGLVEQSARDMGEAWRRLGVHKWNGSACGTPARSSVTESRTPSV